MSTCLGFVLCAEMMLRSRGVSLQTCKSTLASYGGQKENRVEGGGG